MTEDLSETIRILVVDTDPIVLSSLGSYIAKTEIFRSSHKQRME